MPGAGERDGEDERRDDRGSPTDHEADRAGGIGGIRFSLPPIRLPDRAFPSDLRVVLPPPGRARRAGLSERSVLVVALAFDLVDAWLALTGVGPVLDWGRVTAGLGLAAAAAGITGSLYAWEAVVLALGAGPLTAVPTLTLLVRRARSE